MILFSLPFNPAEKYSCCISLSNQLLTVLEQINLLKYFLFVNVIETK